MKTDRFQVSVVTVRPGSERRGAGQAALVERQVASLFDRLFASVPSFRSPSDCAWHPFTDVHETAEAFFIRMELAGIDRERLLIEQDGRCLVVRGYRDEAEGVSSAACHQMEISVGPFERAICLPLDFRGDQVTAEYGRLSGVLEIKVSKEEAR